MSSVARRYYERGRAALDAGDLESAQEALRAALELAPSFGNARVAYAVALARAGDCPRAAQVLRAGLGRASSPISAAAMYATLGDVLTLGGDFFGAEEAFQQARRRRGSRHASHRASPGCTPGSAAMPTWRRSSSSRLRPRASPELGRAAARELLRPRSRRASPEATLDAIRTDGATDDACLGQGCARPCPANVISSAASAAGTRAPGPTTGRRTSAPARR